MLPMPVPDHFPAHIRPVLARLCGEAEQRGYMRGKADGHAEILGGIKALHAFLPPHLSNPPVPTAMTMPAGMPVQLPVNFSQPMGVSAQATDGDDADVPDDDFDLDAMLDEVLGDGDWSPSERQELLAIAITAIREALTEQGKDPTQAVERLRMLAGNGKAVGRVLMGHPVWMAWQAVKIESPRGKYQYKAVGTGEHEGRVAYGADAEAKLKRQGHGGGGPGHEEVESGNRQYLESRTKAHAAASDAIKRLQSRQVLSAPEFDGMVQHLSYLTTGQLKGLRTGMIDALKERVKGGKRKAQRMENLTHAIKTIVQYGIKPDIDFDKSGTSLADVVKSYGGIDPSDHEFQRHFGSANEARQYGVATKKGGRSLDDLAKNLVSAGHLVVPDGHDPTQALVDALQGKQKAATSDDSEHWDKAYEAHAAQQEFDAANARADQPAEEEQSAEAEGQAVPTDADDSFDFGANEVAPADSLDADRGQSWGDTPEADGDRATEWGDTPEADTSADSGQLTTPEPDTTPDAEPEPEMEVSETPPAAEPAMAPAEQPAEVQPAPQPAPPPTKFPAMKNGAVDVARLFVGTAGTPLRDQYVSRANDPNDTLITHTAKVVGVTPDHLRHFIQSDGVVSAPKKSNPPPTPAATALPPTPAAEPAPAPEPAKEPEAVAPPVEQTAAAPQTEVKPQPAVRPAEGGGTPLVRAAGEFRANAAQGNTYAWATALPPDAQSELRGILQSASRGNAITPPRWLHNAERPMFNDMVDVAAKTKRLPKWILPKESQPATEAKTVEPVTQPPPEPAKEPEAVAPPVEQTATPAPQPTPATPKPAAEAKPIPDDQHAIYAAMKDAAAGMSGRAKMAMESAVENASGHADEMPQTGKPTPEAKQKAGKRLLVRRMVSAIHTLRRQGHDGDAGQLHDFLTRVPGVSVPHEVGDVVPFDPKFHDLPVGIKPGLPVRIKEPGYMVRETDGGRYLVLQGKAEPVTPDAKPSEPATPEAKPIEPVAETGQLPTPPAAPAPTPEPEAAPAQPEMTKEQRAAMLKAMDDAVDKENGIRRMRGKKQLAGEEKLAVREAARTAHLASVQGTASPAPAPKKTEAQLEAEQRANPEANQPKVEKFGGHFKVLDAETGEFLDKFGKGDRKAVAERILAMSGRERKAVLKAYAKHTASDMPSSMRPGSDGTFVPDDESKTSRLTKKRETDFIESLKRIAGQADPDAVNDFDADPQATELSGRRSKEDEDDDREAAEKMGEIVGILSGKNGGIAGAPQSVEADATPVNYDDALGDGKATPAAIHDSLVEDALFGDGKVDADKVKGLAAKALGSGGDNLAKMAHENDMTLAEVKASLGRLAGVEGVSEPSAPATEPVSGEDAINDYYVRGVLKGSKLDPAAALKLSDEELSEMAKDAGMYIGAGEDEDVTGDVAALKASLQRLASGQSAPKAPARPKVNDAQRGDLKTLLRDKGDGDVGKPAPKPDSPKDPVKRKRNLEVALKTLRSKLLGSHTPEVMAKMRTKLAEMEAELETLGGPTPKRRKGKGAK